VSARMRGTEGRAPQPERYADFSFDRDKEARKGLRLTESKTVGDGVAILIYEP